MNYPFFYAEEISADELVLDEDTSRHIATVLRMQAGEFIHLTNGKGQLLTAEITGAHKKKSAVRVTGRHFHTAPVTKTAIAISLLKNTTRFEWFLEKATELGISAIYPLRCERTEKQHFRTDRMKNVLISAMLQSRQCWLPQLPEPQAFPDWLSTTGGHTLLMAHCMEGDKQPLASLAPAAQHPLVMIGPEGDFSAAELELALAAGAKPVSLGETRLRTETAGVVAAAMLTLNKWGK